MSYNDEADVLFLEENQSDVSILLLIAHNSGA